MNATNSSSVITPCENIPLAVVTFNVYITVGPMALGALVNACLFGCLVVQTYVYYANFANDHRWIKPIKLCSTSQIAHVICVSSSLWSVAVSGYGDPSRFEVFPWGADATILFTGITGTLIELSFAFRLWRLSKRFYLPLLSLALCLVAQSVSFVIAVKAFIMTSVAIFAHDQNMLITLSLTSRVVCELTLTMAIAWYLRRQRLSMFSRHATLFPIRSSIINSQDDKHD
ncbi:hypothetical protein BDR05DRAFT_1028760 [Suillus weaverae]|nr:hypothetical protein BDR05DRAFT_1028760 [Suillus weaverae]